jgi:2-iminobutanoate/2-iminopropanoate deaminase
MRHAIILKCLPPPPFTYSHLTRCGPHYYFSGMLALDRSSGVLVDSGVGGQMTQILENLQLAMAELELDFEHLALTRIFTTEMDRFAEINQAWDKVFNAAGTAPPARTSIGVSALPLKALVEIECTFYKPE